LAKDVSLPQGEAPPYAEVPVTALAASPLAKTPGPDTDREESVSKPIPGNLPPPQPAAVLSAEESMGAALPPQADSTGGSSDEFEPSSDTLKGVPVDTLFADQETKKDVPPPPVATPDSNAVRNPMENRSTKPLGLAERLLSEDSAVRASAMHEAIGNPGGKVEGPQSTDRNTREYGNPASESAAALVQEVVSSAHDIKRESPPPVQPERPTKEVDWGAWPAGLAPSPKRLDESVAKPSRPASAPELNSVESPSAIRSSSEGETDKPAAPLVEQAAPKEVVPQEPEEPPALPVPDLLDGDGDESSKRNELQPASPNNVASGASAQASSEASMAAPVVSPSKSTRPKPQSKVDTSRTARKTIPSRKIWLLAWGALALGVIGYLALGKTAPSPGESKLSAPSAVEPSPSPPKAPVPEPIKMADQNRPPVAPLAAPKSDKSPAKPGLGTSPSAAADLRRRCLEVNAEGKGKAKAVSAACRPALGAEPKDAELMVILARAEIDRGHLVEARSLAKKALATDPQRLDAYVFLGTAEQEAGRLDEARAAYKKYLELAPDGPFARELRAILNNL
ncbi:MAG TPA: tetratricopeptide repeat protein, partial [Polyangia bacterium]